jgi:hypothetical protein
MKSGDIPDHVQGQLASTQIVYKESSPLLDSRRNQSFKNHFMSRVTIQQLSPKENL